jgi:DNA-binding CsgD family transcriptional regulator
MLPFYTKKGERFVIKCISLITIASVALYVYLTITILNVKPRTRNHVLLGVCSFFLTVWTLFAYFTCNAETIEQFTLFFYISMTGIFVFFPLQNIFVRAMTGKVRFWYLLLVVLPALGFALKNIDSTILFTDFYQSEAGWMFVSAKGTLWYMLWSGYTAVVFGTAILFLMLRYKSSSRQREKRQIKLLIIASGLSTVLIMADYLLPLDALRVTRFMPAPLLLVPWVSGYVIAITRYQLFNITPEKVTRRIIEAIDECVILLSPEGKPTYMNPKALQYFGKPHGTIEEITTDQLFLLSENNELQLPAVYQDGIVKKRVALRVSGNSTERPVLDMELTQVFDKFDDPLGFLLIGKEVRTLESVQNQFDLTNREIEVVGCIVNGWNTAVIARYLDITRRTVKAHIGNIYQKCQVTNRVSLINTIVQGGSR